MAEIRRADGRTIIDYTARDYESFLLAMRDLIPAKLPEWKDHASEADFGNVLLELFAHMGDMLSYYQDRIANESFLGTAQLRSSVIHHLRLIGYRLGTAAPASTTLTLTVPATCNEPITIRAGAAFATKSQRDRPSIRFEYTGETALLIPCAVLPVEKTTNKKVFQGIPVEEGRRINDEIVGISDGRPNQRFTLAHPRLIVRPAGMGTQRNQDLVVTTEFGGVRDSEPWTLQESLAFSRERQKHVVVEIDDDDRATLIFGDGAFGAIPARDTMIRATYRVGGGTHGNVAAGTIQTIIDAPQLALLAAQVTNPSPASGGADRESIEHAVQHAPNVFRAHKRAVTEEDYKALALNFPGVGKVRAEATSWNTVKLFVAPQGGGFVSDTLEAELLAYFEDKRQIGTRIDIEDVTYVPIYVTAQVGVTRYYTPEAVIAQVKAVAASQLAFENVDFAQPLYLSKFYEVIEQIDGVEYVTITEFRRGDPHLPNPAHPGQPPGYIEPTGKLQLRTNEIPTAPDSSKRENAAYRGGLQVMLEENS